MHTDLSFFSYLAQSSIIIKLVILILISASLLSWTYILQRTWLIKHARRAVDKFEDKFWAGSDLNKLYHDIQHRRDQVSGLEHIFSAGFKEYLRIKKQPNHATILIDGVQRAMRIARYREMDQLEQHLSFLATVGSTSPYVGLFGTVWGIMNAFHALGSLQQATISMVAPGISEALITTAMGLFAAIPAVIAYNRLANEVDRLLNHYETFQEEFANILARQNLVASDHYG